MLSHVYTATVISNEGIIKDITVEGNIFSIARWVQYKPITIDYDRPGFLYYVYMEIVEDQKDESLSEEELAVHIYIRREENVSSVCNGPPQESIFTKII